MKITIAYLPEEERKADLIRRYIARHLDGLKCRESERHGPFKHMYLSTKKPKKTDVERENA